MKKIIRPGKNSYRAHCHECGAEFTYQREDVHHNYVCGGDWVSCPCCGHDIRHFGESGADWPRPIRRHGWTCLAHEGQVRNGSWGR